MVNLEYLTYIYLGLYYKVLLNSKLFVPANENKFWLYKLLTIWQSDSLQGGQYQ